MSSCIVCSKTSKYKCPKCKVSYCSLPHYKSHNLFCAEEFYKTQCQQHLKSHKSSSQEQKKMRQILRKAEQEDIPDYLKQRYQEILEKIDEGEEIQLTHDEQVKFSQWTKKWVMEQGQKQFWQNLDGMSAYYLSEVKQHQSNNQTQNDVQQGQFDEQLVFYRKQYKRMIDSFPPVSSMCSNPNKCLIYHIYSLVFSGCVIFRYFDGQVSVANPQCRSLLQAICPLKSLPLLQSVTSAHYFLQNNDRENLLRPWMSISRGDAAMIFKNRYLIIEMLLRLNQIMDSKKIKKKIDFYCSYMKDILEQDLKKMNWQIQESVLVQQVQAQGPNNFQKYKDLFKVK